MKKRFFTSLVTLMILGIGTLSFSMMTFSLEEDQIGEELNKIASCGVDYTRAMDAAQRDWDNNLRTLVDQEKPASEMVDDAYENLRTYNCWLEYICRGVLYSGYAPTESIEGTGLTSQLIGRVPGCQKPEDIILESEWEGFLNTLKKVPILGATGKPLSDVFKSKMYIPGKFSMFPGCMTDAHNNNNPDLVLANSNYQLCRIALEERFGCQPETEEEEDFLGEPKCTQSSSAFTGLESVLKKAHGSQKASALETKLGDILSRMHAMDARVTYLDNFLQQLDSRLSCYAAKCD